MLFPDNPCNSRSWCGAITVQNDPLSPCPRWATRHSTAVIALVNPFHPLRRNDILQCYSVTRKPSSQSRDCRIGAGMLQDHHKASAMIKKATSFEPILYLAFLLIKTNKNNRDITLLVG